MRKFLAMALFVQAAAALEEDQMSIKDQALKLIKANQHHQALELIESQQDILKVAETYSAVVKEVYWMDKNGSNVVYFGKAGVVYSLKKSQEYKKSDNKLSLEMKAWAKTLAYDVAANTWPGWGDPGVVISSEEMEEGLNMAKLNLVLALELNKPKDKVAIAHWMIGAHLLAKKEFGLAIGAFETSQKISFEITDNLSVLLNDGYIGLAKKLRGDEDGPFQFRNAVRSLESMGTEDSKFYASQLKAALAVFAH